MKHQDALLNLALKPVSRPAVPKHFWNTLVRDGLVDTKGVLTDAGWNSIAMSETRLTALIFSSCFSQNNR